MYPKCLDEMTEEELVNLIAEMHARIDDGECNGCEHISASVTNIVCIRCCQKDD